MVLDISIPDLCPLSYFNITPAKCSWILYEFEGLKQPLVD